MATEVADLTEDQIDRLLREAEERLAQQSAVSKAGPSSKALQLAVPEPETTLAAAPAAGKDARALPVKKDDVVIRVPQFQNKKDKKNPDDAGPNWFGLPKTVVTPEAKRDFQVLRMRGVVDAKHHFRKDTRRDLIPKFSAFGTIVEGAMEGRGARLTRKERRRTIAEEVLASQTANDSFKKRYGKIQDQRTSGKKAFYKKLVGQRRRRP